MAGSHSATIRTGELRGWFVDVWSLPGAGDRYSMRADAPPDPYGPPADPRGPLPTVGVRYHTGEGRPGYEQLSAAYHGGVEDLEKALRWVLATLAPTS